MLSLLPTWKSDTFQTGPLREKILLKLLVFSEDLQGIFMLRTMPKSVVCTVLLTSVFVGLCGVNSMAEDHESTPGFIAGDERPDTIPPAVKWQDGWLVPYEEEIPGTDISFKMVPVPAGRFTLGSPGNESGRDESEGPQCEIDVAPFWMGACEVTWAEYKSFMRMLEVFAAMESAGVRLVTDNNEVDAVTAPSALYDPTTTYINGEEPEQPAVTMTQYAARQYTQWLSGLTGRFYRLPAEAEWEYACRAGSDTPFSCSAEDLTDYAWFSENADDTTHLVAEKKPNAWGLHDMHGNASEWVIDELVEGGYAAVAEQPSPVAVTNAIRWPVEVESRVIRGGAYYDEPAQCRSAARRGSEDEAWKDVDPNLPKSPFWYTEEPALGVGMRVVRPVHVPADADAKRRWWRVDNPDIEFDVDDRVSQGRGSRGLVDPTLPEEAKELGLTE